MCCMTHPYAVMPVECFPDAFLLHVALLAHSSAQHNQYENQMSIHRVSQYSIADGYPLLFCHNQWLEKIIMPVIAHCLLVFVHMTSYLQPLYEGQW